MRGESWRILLLPAHATTISIKIHSRNPVPFAIAGRGIQPDGVGRFDEAASRAGGYGMVQATIKIIIIYK